MLTRRQLNEWMAFANVEKIGDPVELPDPKAIRKARRNRVEAGFKQLMEKQGGNR